MKRVLILLLIAAQASGAEYYVRSSGGSDSNNGTTWALGKATINGGLAVATGGNDRVNVSPGTYSSESSGRVVFTTGHAGDTIVFRKWAGVDGGGNACPIADGACTFSSTNTIPLWFNTNVTSGTFTWDGIDITSSQATDSVFLDDVATTMSVTIKNCSINGDVYGAGAQAPSRNVSLDNLTITPASGVGFVRIFSASAVSVTGCTMTKTGGSDAGGPYLNFGDITNADLGSLTISGCTITNSVVSARTLINVGANITSGLVRIKDNTLSHTKEVIRIQAATGSAVRGNIEGNTITLNDTGQGAVSAYAIFIGTEADTSTDSLGPIVISGNTINQRGTGSATSVVMMLCPEALGAEVSYNTILGHGYWDDTDKGIGIYLRGCTRTNVHHNAIHSRSGIVPIMCDGSKIQFNTVYTKKGTDIGAPFSVRDGNTDTDVDTKNLVVTDNIFVAGSGCDNIMSFQPHGGGIDLSTLICDRNVYWKEGSASGSFYKSSTGYTFATLKSTVWVGAGSIAAFNDLNSVYADPRIAYPAGGDLRIANSSPAKGEQSASNPYLPLWNDKGAFQRRFSAGGGRPSVGGGLDK